MQNKLKHYAKVAAAYGLQLKDPKYIGQLLFLVIVLLISWSGVKAIQTNYGLQKRISALEQQNAVKKLENANLNLQNEYYNTDQYLELSARQNFGLAAPGEKEIVVPENVALAYTVDLAQPTKPATPTSKQPVYQRNFEAWVNFFLHRQNTSN